MKEKYKKISILIFVVMLILVLFCSYVDAATLNGFSGKIGTKEKTTAKNIIVPILSITRTIGATVAVVILIVIGCKYMLASAGDRADIKKYAINYFVGALILFGASGILTIVKQTVDSSF